MKNTQKKNIIKIPVDTTAIYCNKKKIITFIGPLNTKSLKLRVKLLLLKNKTLIEVTSAPFSEMSSNQLKKIKAIKGTTVALIKQLLIETSAMIYRKLKFVGVGYRAFKTDDFNDSLLMFKLGYSHPLYFKISKNLNIFCLKLTKIFVFGHSFHHVTQTASLIRSYKKPEPYKGKGILHETEKIILKEGKKV